jgi:hypothetical protein
MYACKKMCNECPFSPDSLPGWLAGYEPIDLHRIVMAELPFPCHKTHIDRELTWEEGGTKENPLCRGALIYMRKNAKQPRNPEIQKHTNTVTKEDFELVMSTPEFLEHHANGFQNITGKI